MPFMQKKIGDIFIFKKILAVNNSYCLKQFQRNKIQQKS